MKADDTERKNRKKNETSKIGAVHLNGALFFCLNQISTTYTLMIENKKKFDLIQVGL